MNKADLEEVIYQYHGALTRKEVEKVMGVFLKVLKETLSKGDKIKLHGFGSFETVQRKGKTGIHPKTGSPVKIKPRKTVVFHISPNCWVEK